MSSPTPGDSLERGETRTKGTYRLVREHRRRGYKHDTYRLVLELVSQSYVDGQPYGSAVRKSRALAGGLCGQDARELAESITSTLGPAAS